MAVPLNIGSISAPWRRELAMISKPVRECRQGHRLWVSKSLDALRHYECLRVVVS